MKIAITCGDPAGVGPEIIEHWISNEAGAGIEATIFGPAAWGRDLAAQSGVTFSPVGSSDFSVEPGVPSEAGARLALEAMETAAARCRVGRFDAVVTAPISKSWLQRVGFTFPGQSEFFAARWGGDPTMAFTGGRLRVVLATWHIPVSEVPAAVTPAALRLAVERAAWLARAEGCTEPRIAVCGLNPHAGEDGMMGREEIDVLNPALEDMRGELPGLTVCLPGDTVFSRVLRNEFDVVVALYHDQGLAPLKAIDFDTAVNVTLGLPHIRTSPDHGTAFGIAGKGIANPASFANAVQVAVRLARHRKTFPF